MTELLPHLGELVDDMAFVHSMTKRANTHGPACVMMITGFVFEGFPSAGSWLSYALGAETEDLPAYVAIPDVRGIPPSGPANWTSGFLPRRASGRGVQSIRADPELRRPGGIGDDEESATRGFLALLNREHQARYPGNPNLQARIASYELAARMQLSAPEVSALEKEPAEVHDFYGTRNPNPLIAAYAKNCLLSRRLLERAVGYVHLFCASRASGVDGL